MDVFVKPTLTHVEGLKLTTVDTYVVVPLTLPKVVTNGEFSIQGMRSKTLTLVAAAQDLRFRVEMSPDGTKFSTFKDDILVAAGYFTYFWSDWDPDIAGLWHSMRISVKPNVAGVHGTGIFYLEAGTL